MYTTYLQQVYPELPLENKDSTLAKGKPSVGNGGSSAGKGKSRAEPIPRDVTTAPRRNKGEEATTRHGASSTSGASVSKRKIEFVLSTPSPHFTNIAASFLCMDLIL